MPARPFAFVTFDGRRLSDDPSGNGRRLRIDARCLAGEPVAGAHAHVCALPDRHARLPYDMPEVQQARRDALEWWIPFLGDSLVCMTTIVIDAVHCGGAITVARDPSLLGADPFARLFPGTVVPTDLFSLVPPPPGPAFERYAGAPWPGGAFAQPGPRRGARLDRASHRRIRSRPRVAQVHDAVVGDRGEFGSYGLDASSRSL